MEAVRIHAHLDSDTLHLPELGALVGKDVEIIVIEEKSEEPCCGKESFFELAGNIDLNEEAITRLREDSTI